MTGHSGERCLYPALHGLCSHCLCAFGHMRLPCCGRPLHQLMQCCYVLQPQMIKLKPLHMGAGVDWRQKLENQRGAVLATELKNNANKLARWTAAALVSGADIIKLGYVSRNHPRDNKNHVILGTQACACAWVAMHVSRASRSAAALAPPTQVDCEGQGAVLYHQFLDTLQSLSARARLCCSQMLLSEVRPRDHGAAVQRRGQPGVRSLATCLPG